MSIMNSDLLLKLLDGLAQEYLLLDCEDIDIPTAGKLLNHLEQIAKESEVNQIKQISNCANGLSHILEKVILDSVTDKVLSANILAEGIHLMQEIADSFKNVGRYDGNIQDFLDKLSAITGVAVSGDDSSAQEEIVTDVDFSQKEDMVQVQDESLIKDFIAEGLEYIEEIEVNILNLENEPDNKDYINTIFRPFHSIKGVASFLNLEKIRSLAHSLENLLDKARNGEIDVNPALIDVILDGADALKTLIVQLRDSLEGKKIDESFPDDQ